MQRLIRLYDTRQHNIDRYKNKPIKVVNNFFLLLKEDMFLLKSEEQQQ